MLEYRPCGLPSPRVPAEEGAINEDAEAEPVYLTPPGLSRAPPWGVGDYGEPEAFRPQRLERRNRVRVDTSTGEYRLEEGVTEAIQHPFVVYLEDP